MKLSKSFAITGKMRPAIRPVLRPVVRPGMFKTSKRSGGGTGGSGSSGGSGNDWNPNREFAFNIFVDEFKRSKQCKSMVKKMVKKSASEKWSVLSEEEKERYDEKVVQRSLEFDQCVQVYLKLMQDLGQEHEEPSM